MPFQNDAVPSKTEVTGQLERILSSDIFTAAAKQARVLRFVVEHAMAGTAINGSVINSEMFPSVDPDSTNARTNVSLVRQRLKDYYDGPGSDDLVRVELPPGPGYRAIFSYHQKSQAIRWFRKGSALRGSGGQSLFAAKDAFGQAIAIDSGYVAAHAAIAEVELLEFLADHVLLILPPSPQKTFYRDPEAPLKAWKFDADVWLLHAVVGMGHLLSGHRKEAGLAFEMAMQVDPDKTGRSIWYGAYLLLTGRQDDGVSIAQALVNEQPENIWATIMLGFFLYVKRDFVRADKVLREMVTYDSAEVFHSLIHGLIKLGLGKSASAVELFEDASVISRDEWKILRAERGFSGHRADRFPGLIILALVKDGRKAAAEEGLAILKKQRFVKPFQLVIAHMALGEIEESLEALRHAIKMGDIMAPWLGLFAFFDEFPSSRFEHIKERFKSSF